jgi:hypothetical protein
MWTGIALWGVFLLFGITYHSNFYDGDSKTLHHYPTHTSPDSLIIMNKVFGMVHKIRR